MTETQTLIWIDLEMTGLDPHKDTILEIAVIVTDNNLQLLKEGPSLIIHADDALLNRMHADVYKMHADSGLLAKVKESRVTLEHAHEQVMQFLTEYAQPQSPLCGNSIWVDKMFLIRLMPQIVAFAHYRIIDVSSIKELVLRWYGNNPDATFVKGKAHRALDDIRESIAELKHYRRYFFA